MHKGAQYKVYPRLSPRGPRVQHHVPLALGLGTEKAPSRVGRLIGQRENRSMEGLSDLFKLAWGAVAGTVA